VKALLLEVPIARIGPDGNREIAAGDTSPLSLLRLAEAIQRAGCPVEFIPATQDWEALLPGCDPTAARQFVERTLSREPDALFLNLSSFNRPLVERLLAALAQTESSRRRPRIVLVGAHRKAFSALSKKPDIVDAAICCGYEDRAEQLLESWESAGSDQAPQPLSPTPGLATHEFAHLEDAPANQVELLTAIQQLTAWPRWDQGVQTAETYGFPLDSQPHPWNLPADPQIDCGSLKEWLDLIDSPIQAMREPQVWISTSQPVWNRELVSALGEFSLRYIKRDRIAPKFAVRAYADRLNLKVLPSLAVLNVVRVDLLAGSGNHATLARFTDQYTLGQLSDCVREMKDVGLAGNTRIVCVLGLPGEGIEEAMESVTFCSNLAVENSVAEVKYEWWMNAPGSPFHKPDHSGPAGQETPWFGDENAINQIPASISPDDRRALMSTIQFLRTVHLGLKIHGPSLI
jgi:hypothetical protein